MHCNLDEPDNVWQQGNVRIDRGLTSISPDRIWSDRRQDRTGWLPQTNIHTWWELFQVCIQGTDVNAWIQGKKDRKNRLKIIFEKFLNPKMIFFFLILILFFCNSDRTILMLAISWVDGPGCPPFALLFLFYMVTLYWLFFKSGNLYSRLFGYVHIIVEKSGDLLVIFFHKHTQRRRKLKKYVNTLCTNGKLATIIDESFLKS